MRGYINFGESEYEYPVNFYNGCGSYYLAKKSGKLVASVNFTSDMSEDEDDVRENFEREVMKRFGDGIDVFVADGSGTTFFARDESDVSDVKTKVYYVPSYHGGRHKNIEILW